MSEIYHKYTKEIVCPYCGLEFTDSWEYCDEETLYCEDCEKEFLAERDIEITYITRKIDEVKE